MSEWRGAQSRQSMPVPARATPARERNGAASVPGTGYTITHAGRQIRFGPVAFWIAVGSVVVMAGWSVATATYFAFRDDVLKGLIARQAEQQFAYEDRLAELRAQIDRTTSRQLLDQEQFERKLDDLARREATLESHATALGGLVTRRRPAPSGVPRAAGRRRSERLRRSAILWLHPSVPTTAHRSSLPGRQWAVSGPRRSPSSRLRLIASSGVRRQR